ncbi:ribonuclease P protein component [Thalassotalea agarivorans]|uniref:Ribonuclease P protein component n=1 Tax=Thalassotalea agarivorans TaxID=349064 RepID=A0A1I0GCB7_THASX|nr:ribonuclease P protein component [Thalassotalea agarivorans]SET68619.1 ribonuclease P protein component [Thalassotalea agarivorans]
MVTHEFSRESRLLTPEHFSNVFKNPSRFGSSHFTILVTQNENNINRLGLAIAKKRVKLAVQRNRVKRIIRESYRLNQHKLPHIDMVVMVKSGIDQLENQQIEQQLAYIWRKIKRRQPK